ncbi:DUF6234 family protein [Streptomyces drozdowiczii]|uniref:DUF6234 family protein n=1 Tax=Streptomyces drozdowiczii TaxID=202862 RepID=A0ABY6PRH4_9ACTN|nr:DUF6234 family protein [Streptomyces drozdowiczii]MCX0245549.1 DUF6234 family protein [Streptomyces drozdowiczii]UZK54823.1 DUF6234 family protein [Streptomyces drozdowiczii]
MRIRTSDRPAPSRPGPVVTGCLDMVLGLLLIALEGLVSAVLFYAYTGSDPRPPGPDMAEAGPPGMDWSGTLVLAAVTAVACLIGVVLLRHGLPIAGAVQLIGVCLLLVLTLTAWHDAYEDAHPEPGDVRAYAASYT